MENDRCTRTGGYREGVVQRASGFDMHIYGYDIIRDDAFLNKYNVCFTDVDTIIRECDLHFSTPSTDAGNTSYPE